MHADTDAQELAEPDARPVGAVLAARPLVREPEGWRGACPDEVPDEPEPDPLGSPSPNLGTLWKLEQGIPLDDEQRQEWELYARAAEEAERRRSLLGIV